MEDMRYENACPHCRYSLQNCVCESMAPQPRLLVDSDGVAHYYEGVGQGGISVADDWLDGYEFYTAMQGYRHVNQFMQHPDGEAATAAAFESVKKMIRARIEALVRERDAYKAVLIGAEYSNVELLPQKGISFCDQLGRTAASRTKELLRRAESAEARLREGK